MTKRNALSDLFWILVPLVLAALTLAGLFSAPGPWDEAREALAGIRAEAEENDPFTALISDLFRSGSAGISGATLSFADPGFAAQGEETVVLSGDALAFTAGGKPYSLPAATALAALAGVKLGDQGPALAFAGVRSAWEEGVYAQLFDLLRPGLKVAPEEEAELTVDGSRRSVRVLVFAGNDITERAAALFEALREEKNASALLALQTLIQALSGETAAPSAELLSALQRETPVTQAAGEVRITLYKGVAVGLSAKFSFQREAAWELDLSLNFRGRDGTKKQGSLSLIRTQGEQIQSCKLSFSDLLNENSSSNYARKFSLVLSDPSYLILKEKTDLSLDGTLLWDKAGGDLSLLGDRDGTAYTLKGRVDRWEKEAFQLTLTQGYLGTRPLFQEPLTLTLALGKAPLPSLSGADAAALPEKEKAQLFVPPPLPEPEGAPG